MKKMADWASVLTGIAAIVMSIVALYNARRKTNAEVHLTDAEAAGKIGMAAASLVEPLQKRLTVVEAELVETCQQIEAMEQEIKALREENDLLRDWANRLVYQVQSLGVEPVKLKGRRA